MSSRIEKKFDKCCCMDTTTTTTITPLSNNNNSKKRRRSQENNNYYNKPLLLTTTNTNYNNHIVSVLIIMISIVLILPIQNRVQGYVSSSNGLFTRLTQRGKTMIPSSSILLGQQQQQYNKNRLLRLNRLYSTTTAVAASSTTTTTSSSSAAVALKHVEFSTTTSSTSSTSANKHPPAIFLHGLLGNKRNFASIGTSLIKQIERKRQIFSLDLRNHGENHHDWRDEMNYADMAKDVIHFCDRHGFDKVELIGHSVGGKVAQAVALMEPTRVNGLVVIDIAPVRYTEDEPHWKAVSDIIDTLTNKVTIQPGMTKRDIDQQLKSYIPDPALRAFCLTNVDVKNGKWTIHLDSISKQLDVLADFNVDEIVGKTTTNGQEENNNNISKQYHGDSFFIHGGQSRFVRHKHLETIGQYFPNHMLTTIRGAGHWVHAEAPEDTTSLLKRFLDR